MLRPQRKAPAPAPGSLTLKRKDYYDLTLELRGYATELAAMDPRRVNLPQCHKFNAFLRRVRAYDRLAPALADMRGARPVARWQVATLVLVIWLFVSLAMIGRGERLLYTMLANGLILSFITLYLVPERVFGTTIEEIEGKVLRVVLRLEELLTDESLALTEAVFFKARENLDAARRELRQQIDLAHRQ